MNPRVSVGMSYSDGGFVTGVVIAVLGIGAAAVVTALDGDETLAAILAGVGGFGVFLAMLRHATISRNRRWLAPTDTGFILTDRRGEFEFADEMVSDLATWVKVVYSNGNPHKNRRTGGFVITAGEASVNFQFGYDFPLGQTDPLGPMLDRVFDKLVAAAKENVQRGRRLVGDNWALDKAQLTFTPGKEDVSLPLRDMSAVDLTEGQICVWRKGEAEAAFKVKAGDPNALILGRVLQDILPKDRPEEDPGDGLGRIIFERDQSIRGANRVAGVLLIAVGALVGLAVTAFGAMEGNFVALIGALILLGCVAGAVAIWNKRINMFRCHAYGVARTTPKGVAKLKYSEIGTFTYSGVRQYVNGSYTGTTVTLQFQPLENVEAEPIRYSATFKNEDNELDNLRDFISRVVAGHMLRRLQDGQTVKWTDKVRFLTDGLEVAKSGWFQKKGETIHLPYNMIGQYDLTNGVFRISHREQSKWLVEEPVSQPNFFPGYVLLMMILHPTPEPSAPEPAAE